jgi:hypothetical protein
VMQRLCEKGTLAAPGILFRRRQAKTEGA